MDKNILLESAIKNIVKETIVDIKKNQLLEEIKQKAISILKEDEAFNKKMNQRRKDDVDNATNKKSKRSFVLNKLNNSGIVQADAMRSIWHSVKGTPEDDINRSLFSKMCREEPDESAGGVIRRFDDNEITKLAQYIHDIGA